MIDIVKRLRARRTMTDIVERLQAYGLRSYASSQWFILKDTRDAAEEIERLREEIEARDAIIQRLRRDLSDDTRLLQQALEALEQANAQSDGLYGYSKRCFAIAALRERLGSRT